MLNINDINEDAMNNVFLVANRVKKIISTNSDNNTIDVMRALLNDVTTLTDLIDNLKT